MIAADGTYISKASHEVLGEWYLRQLGFSEKVCQIVGAHVVAKRYLCAVEKGYWKALSRSSKQTLEFQVLPAASCIYQLPCADYCRVVSSATMKSQRRRQTHGWSRSWPYADGTILRRTRI